MAPPTVGRLPTASRLLVPSGQAGLRRAGHKKNPSIQISWRSSGSRNTQTAEAAPKKLCWDIVGGPTYLYLSTNKQCRPTTRWVAPSRAPGTREAYPINEQGSQGPGSGNDVQGADNGRSVYPPESESWQELEAELGNRGEGRTMWRLSGYFTHLLLEWMTETMEGGASHFLRERAP